MASRAARIGGAGYFSPAPPRLFAHRGLAIDAPENTLLAFAKALALGVTYLETDVHASADGLAIVSHDPDLIRLTGRSSMIADLTSAELARIDLGDGQTLMTLAAALDAFPNAMFNIDIKVAAAAAPAAAAIRAANAEHRVLVGSFRNSRRRAAVRLLPGVATSASSGAVLLATWAAAIGLRVITRAVLRSVDAVQIPERILGVRSTSPRVLRAFHAAGVEVHIWTINDAATMERLLDAGVDGIMTDRADIGIEVFERRSQR